jgi:outer membrane protein OmpA-like peptidoglycan-associated protein
MSARPARTAPFTRIARPARPASALPPVLALLALALLLGACASSGKPVPDRTATLRIGDPPAQAAKATASPAAPTSALDADDDGVLDVDDFCPNEAEDQDECDDEDGCPDPDNDGDGVLDADDKCPDELETLNGNEDFDGCFDHPKPIIGQGIEDGRIVMRERIEFSPNSDELLDSDKRILDQVVVVIRANPEIHRFRIEGHTDNYGDKERNVDLSERRAGRVREYLIAHGITENRLFPKGFGPARPIASNRNKAGRAMNRRVEIHVVAPGEPDEGALP